MRYKRYFRKTSLKQKGVGDFFLNEILAKKPKFFLEIGVFHGVTARNVCELLYQIHGNLQTRTFLVKNKMFYFYLYFHKHKNCKFLLLYH